MTVLNRTLERAQALVNDLATSAGETVLHAAALTPASLQEQADESENGHPCRIASGHGLLQAQPERGREAASPASRLQEKIPPEQRRRNRRQQEVPAHVT